MTEAEYKAYTDSVARSREVAEHDVLAKLIDDVRRRLTAEWKGETDALREEVQPTIDSQPDIGWRCVTCVMAPCRTAWRTSATCRGCGSPARR